MTKTLNKALTINIETLNECFGDHAFRVHVELRAKGTFKDLGGMMDDLRCCERDKHVEDTVALLRHKVYGDLTTKLLGLLELDTRRDIRSGVYALLEDIKPNNFEGVEYSK